MNTLDTLRNGRSALRQLVAQARTATLTDHDLDRLAGKIEAAFDQVMGTTPPPAPPPRSPFNVIRGGIS